MNGEITYIEIGTGHCGHTRAFLSELFQWEFHPTGPGGQGWFTTPSTKAGLHGDDPNPGIFVCFGVKDLDAATARVRELGGDAPDPAPVEPGVDRFTICRDPQGVKFGLHERW